MIEFLDKDGTTQLVREIRTAVNGIVAGMAIVYSGTIGTSWAGSEPPYTQSVTVEGLLESDNPIVDIVPDNDYSVAGSQLDGWSEIYRMVPHDNYLVAFTHRPVTVPIPIKLICVRPFTE